MEEKEWQGYALSLKGLLGLEYTPVGLNCLKEPYLESTAKKVRICRAILDAGRGEILQIGKHNNACFGAS